MPALQLQLPEIAAMDAANDCRPPVFVGAPTTLLAQVGGEGGNQTGGAVQCIRTADGYIVEDGYIFEDDELTMRDKLGDAGYEAYASSLHDVNKPAPDAVSGNEKRKGRRAVHASAAARKAAYRADKARIDFTDKPEIASTLSEIAADLDCSKNELLQSIVRFALTNRNWKQVGLYGARRNGVLQ